MAQRVKKVKIENFRNLKSIELDLHKTSIISGENGLGKSNTLNAINWFFTDTLLTDKWGAGENDISSIVPKDAVKGEHTAVTLTFDSGVEFKKVYKTGYDRETGKANKHSTEGYINDVSTKNMNEWNDKLNEIIDFKSIFKNVKEKNLYTDPLYALQKLESKDLRLLLVALGCQVTNEELYKLGFEDLRQYESRYLGDFTQMRMNLKKTNKTLNDEALRFEHLLETVNDIEEFKPDRLDKLSYQRDDVYSEIERVKNDDNQELILNMEQQIRNSRFEYENNKTKRSLEISQKIQDLKLKQYHQLKADSKAHDDKVESLNNSIKELRTQNELLQNTVESYTNIIVDKTAAIKDIAELGKKNQERKTIYAVKLAAAKEKEFTGFVECPNCHEHFIADQEAAQKFEEEKEQNIKEYTSLIEECKGLENKYIENIKNARVTLDNTNLDKKHAEEKISENIAKLESLCIELRMVVNEPITLSKESAEIESEIAELEKQKQSIEVEEEPLEIRNMILDLQNLKEKTDITRAEKLVELNKAVAEIDAEMEKEYIAKSQWENKEKWTKDHDEIIAKINDNDYLLGRVNDFIHTMISTINKRAAEKTGLEFVMLEENLSNDGIKEVCYAVVDGVPFINVNTSQKIVAGTRFIERIKDIVEHEFNIPRNTLPILADRLEGFDYIEKLHNLTTEQLIGTRVSDGKEITVR